MYKILIHDGLSVGVAARLMAVDVLFTGLGGKGGEDDCKECSKGKNELHLLSLGNLFILASFYDGCNGQAYLYGSALQQIGKVLSRRPAGGQQGVAAAGVGMSVRRAGAPVSSSMPCVCRSSTTARPQGANGCCRGPKPTGRCRFYDASAMAATIVSRNVQPLQMPSSDTETGQPGQGHDL